MKGLHELNTKWTIAFEGITPLLLFYNYIFNKFLLERYLNKYEFKYLSTREGDLDILKLDTYQYFKEKEKVVGEAKKLQERFDK